MSYNVTVFYVDEAHPTKALNVKNISLVDGYLHLIGDDSEINVKNDLIRGYVVTSNEKEDVKQGEAV